MRWFEGSIPAAIVSAKQQNSIFLVVITGDDEQSSHLMSSWEDQRVSDATSNCFVAIKIDAKSFFIGENGIPLEVIAGSVSAEELVKRIAKVKQVPAEPILFLSHLLDHLMPAEDGSPSGYVTPAEDQSLSSDDVSLSSQSDEGLNAKNEIKKEVERRKLGKEMLEYKRRQEGERTKRMLEERNREKAEERAARERIKQQIALDRADRAARYAKNMEEVEAAKVGVLQARRMELEAKKEASQRDRSTVARIQFRLPDGSFFTNQFPSETKLYEARQFAAQEVGNRYGNFSLATMFPRREFSGEDLGKTLLELELAPSASIVLLPQTGRPTNTVVQSSGDGFWAVLSTIFYPLLAVWRFISSFLFSTTPPPSTASRSATPRPASASTGESKRESIRKRVLEKRAEDFKKDGNIYRLRTQEDSEDDNNTWNGNSTQQM
ncbi:UBX domain-containing protein 4-like [Scleropages formosus]|uniref:UBX domain-containing protein 4 n=1 Tax=Scleropages formosus TaxID=113540 RepID=A0A0P7TW22_SCLFO|nr:UBX domain-containing protein 4-like [Scleropages formosus]